MFVVKYLKEEKELIEEFDELFDAFEFFEETRKTTKKIALLTDEGDVLESYED